MLLGGADLAQKWSNRSFEHGDTVCDQVAIKLGFSIYDEYIKGILINAYNILSYVVNDNVFKYRTKMPTWPVLNIFDVYLKSVYKFDMKNADAIKQVKKCKVPILYIHGDDDHFVPTENVYRLFNATNEKLRSLYIVKGAGHALSYPLAEGDYEKQLNMFLAKNIK